MVGKYSRFGLAAGAAKQAGDLCVHVRTASQLQTAVPEQLEAGLKDPQFLLLALEDKVSHMFALLELASEEELLLVVLFLFGFGGLGPGLCPDDALDQGVVGDRTQVSAQDEVQALELDQDVVAVAAGAEADALAEGAQGIRVLVVLLETHPAEEPAADEFLVLAAVGQEGVAFAGQRHGPLVLLRALVLEQVQDVEGVGGSAVLHGHPVGAAPVLALHQHGLLEQLLAVVAQLEVRALAQRPRAVLPARHGLEMVS